MLKVFHSVCFLAFEEAFKTIYRNRQADYAKEKDPRILETRRNEGLLLGQRCLEKVSSKNSSFWKLVALEARQNKDDMRSVNQ